MPLARPEASVITYERIAEILLNFIVNYSKKWYVIYEYIACDKWYWGMILVGFSHDSKWRIANWPCPLAPMRFLYALPFLYSKWEDETNRWCRPSVPRPLCLLGTKFLDRFPKRDAKGPCFNKRQGREERLYYSSDPIYGPRFCLIKTDLMEKHSKP